jgi:dehydrogenase/reductase SDR family protein 1
MALPLEGKVAIVTGSSRGIGKGIALCLAEDGADIVVCARSDASAANPLGSIEKTASEIRALGRRAMTVKLDVTGDAEVREMLDSVMREFGHIDIVVNSAARMGMGGGDFWGGSIETMDEYYRTNLRAPFLITQLVCPLMEAQGRGTIINISSGGANLPAPPTPGWSLSPSRTFVGYGITKAGLNRWVAGVAGELFLRNIAIIAVDPGLTIVERNIVHPRPGADYSNAETPETTGRAIAFICRDPIAYTGRVVLSRKIVDDNNLHLEGIMPML